MAFLDAADLHLVETTGSFFAIAGDERDGGAAGQELYDCADAAFRKTKLLTYLRYAVEDHVLGGSVARHEAAGDNAPARPCRAPTRPGRIPEPGLDSRWSAGMAKALETRAVRADLTCVAGPGTASP